MLKTFIYREDKDTWLEEDKSLLMHDLCAFLDEEKKIIYVWNGPKCSAIRLEKGHKSLEELISSYPGTPFQLTILEEVVPNNIQKKLNEMLETVKKEEVEEVRKFSRLTTIRLYFILSLMSILLPFVSTINLYTALTWSVSIGNVEVIADVYFNWLLFSSILIIITLIIFTINIGIGIFERDYEVVMCSSVGLIICAGIILYLSQGIFIFLFQTGSTSKMYLISPIDIAIFLILNLVAVSIFETMNIFKILNFYKIYREFIF